jgi:hypothetical protein
MWIRKFHLQKTKCLRPISDLMFHSNITTLRQVERICHSSAVCYLQPWLMDACLMETPSTKKQTVIQVHPLQPYDQLDGVSPYSILTQDRINTRPCYFCIMGKLSYSKDKLYQTIWITSSSVIRGPLSLVTTIEELLGRKSSGSGLENRDYGWRDQSHWPCGTLKPQTLALTSPASSGRSVGIGDSRSQATEFSILVLIYH